MNYGIASETEKNGENGVTTKKKHRYIVVPSEGDPGTSKKRQRL